MIKLANILLESEGPAPKKIPSEICWHLSETKRSTFPDFGFHIGTELQSLDRGLQMLGDEMVDDPEEGYTIPSDQVDKNKIYFYENAHEGLDGPEPNLSIFTSGNNIKLVQIIKLDTRGWEDGESELDKRYNSL